MKIAICDDEMEIRELLEEKIEKYCFVNNIELNLKTFESGEDFLKQDVTDFDVLFLDVDMPGIDGLETAKAVRETNRDMLIIFLTAYSEFVFESFKVDAFRYLVKPVPDNEMTETLDAIRNKLCAPEDNLSFQFQNEMYSIRYSDIIYIEGMRDKLWIYCKDNTYRWRGALKTLNVMLKDKGFFQVHRSYIINMNKIQKYNSQAVVMEGDYKVPISKYRLDDFKEEYIKYWSKIL